MVGNGNDGKTITQMILDQVQQNQVSIVQLDDKVDRKIDVIHGRLNTQDTERAQLVARVAECARRVNWAYVILGSVILAILGAALKAALTGGI